MEFNARAENGGMVMSSNYERNRFKDYLKKNNGIRLKIVEDKPESKDQRGFFEGAIVPLVTFFQEGMDHRESKHRLLVRDWLKIEFNGKYVKVGSKVNKVATSTKNKLSKGFLDRVLDWIYGNYGEENVRDALNTKAYDNWKDKVYPFGGPDNWIDYLVSLNRLRNPNEPNYQPLTPVLHEQKTSQK